MAAELAAEEKEEELIDEVGSGDAPYSASASDASSSDSSDGPDSDRDFAKTTEWSRETTAGDSAPPPTEETELEVHNNVTGRKW